MARIAHRSTSVQIGTAIAFITVGKGSAIRIGGRLAREVSHSLRTGFDAGHLETYAESDSNTIDCAAGGRDLLRAKNILAQEIKLQVFTMTRRLSAYCSVFLLTSCYLFAQETIPIGRFLDKAKAFEAERKWQQAADVYEKAIRYYPKQKELFVQWQRIERVHSLVRRYNDDSFRNEMLTLSEADAITLLQETYERIFKNYVESISYQR